ncbi:TnpV protein [Paenibacillus sp. F411]|uniref:TnpV protein n=1 Tax=Paenibacillus sp. F411 TaxID=2820239 RepID=UPI001AAFEEBD|nr:TnpV protein [Paenibacillus sp. F411]MBO2946002.1 TnpV protein [Paenibacillus sp. F411]
MPNLASPEPIQIRKYGMLRNTFLKNERKGSYANLLLSEQLSSHLAVIDQTAREQVEWTLTQLLERHPAPDKAAHPLDWTSHMNGLKQQAEELVLSELVYS